MPPARLAHAPRRNLPAEETRGSDKVSQALEIDVSTWTSRCLLSCPLSSALPNSVVSTNLAHPPKSSLVNSCYVFPPPVFILQPPPAPPPLTRSIYNSAKMLMCVRSTWPGWSRRWASSTAIAYLGNGGKHRNLLHQSTCGSIKRKMDTTDTIKCNSICPHMLSNNYPRGPVMDVTHEHYPKDTANPVQVAYGFRSAEGAHFQERIAERNFSCLSYNAGKVGKGT